MVEQVHYFLIPVISALIGGLTNFIAIKLLFRPHNEKKILFFKIQGIFPKRRVALTDKLSTIIAEELLHKEKLIEQLNDNSKLDDLIVKYVKEYVGEIINKKVKKIPLISAFIKESTVEDIEKILFDDFKEGFGPTKDKFLHEAIKGIDIKRAVKEYLNCLSMKEMEDLIQSILKKEFRFIEWSGAVLGFLIGLGQWAIIWF